MTRQVGSREYALWGLWCKTEKWSKVHQAVNMIIVDLGEPAYGCANELGRSGMQYGMQGRDHTAGMGVEHKGFNNFKKHFDAIMQIQYLKRQGKIDADSTTLISASAMQFDTRTINIAIDNLVHSRDE
jgi:hypothetical protein